ncbi:MAG: transglutaminase family protein [Verrucomicrobiales bacterium]|nr:transglutaminase family protein [Verrucomicrobiales bacterium]
MLLSITHDTIFHYSLPARSNINEVRLAPEENERQVPGDLNIVVDPVPEGGIMVSRDLYGNLVHAFEVEQKHPQLRVTSRAEVETVPDNSLKEAACGLKFDNLNDVKSDDSLHEYLVDSHYVAKNPEIWKEAVDVSLDSEQTWGQIAENLSLHVFKSCRWEEQLIHRATTAAEVQQNRVGTCQDFAHLLIGLCRSIGIPARYVSGYLYDPGLDQGDDATFTGTSVSHAWVDFFAPEAGWIGLDPTNQCWVDENYVSVARGRDYGDVAPIRGSLLGGGPKRSMDVSVVIKKR